MQRSIDYIEAHLAEPIDYAEVAAQSYASSYHFQRVFSILCGYTLGEYIRNRRLSLAGAELAAGGAKVIDVALKYGYESPDSFAKAFQKFHGILPSQARSNGSRLRSFSRLVVKLSLEGGSMMEYRIEKRMEMTFIGYHRRFSGTPAVRTEQAHEFYVSTRVNQYLLKGIEYYTQGVDCDCSVHYDIIRACGDDGYDFAIAVPLREGSFQDLEEDLGEAAKRFEKIVVPEGTYLICETERTQYPTECIEDVRRRAVSEWLPTSGYELANAPEIAVTHWGYRRGDAQVNSARYAELWLPIAKKNA